MDKLKKNYLKNLDYILILITLICTVFGCIMIGSAVNSYDSGAKFVIIQSAAAFIGVIAATVICLINYEKYSGFTGFIYGVCILFLIAVLIIGTGREDTGSKSWIRFGPIGIQPSEIVKIGFIITFSYLCSKYGDDLNNPKNILKLCLHTGILLALIMMQPDFGTTMVFIVIFAGILFAAHISYKYIIASSVTIIAAIPVVWNFFLQNYQKNRIKALFDPESDPLNTGYHVMQSKIAIGSGGIFGKGLGKGTQTQLDYLPVKHTDFIYSVIGEELGIIGSTIVLILLFALVLRCLYVAKNSKDSFGSYICVGVACMFLAHIFENIGMCIGIMPVTGIPLPFFSYGGSSIITNMMAVGLVLSVSMRKNKIRFQKKD